MKLAWTVCLLLMCWVAPRAGAWIWTQSDDYMVRGHSGPSCAHGCALEAMLLYDMADLAGRPVRYLVGATWRPPRQFARRRASAYWFRERYRSPEDPGGSDWQQG